MVAAIRWEAQSPHEEHRFVLQGVPWWTYVALRDALDDHAGLTELAKFVRPGESQTGLVKTYQAVLRAR